MQELKNDLCIDLPEKTYSIGNKAMTCEDQSEVCEDEESYECRKLSFICLEESPDLIWLIIALVAVTVIGSMITVYLYVKLQKQRKEQN